MLPELLSQFDALYLDWITLFSELGFIFKMVKIFVGNLTDECTNEDLQTLFSQYELIAKSRSSMSRSDC